MITRFQGFGRLVQRASGVARIYACAILEKMVSFSARFPKACQCIAGCHPRLGCGTDLVFPKPLNQTFIRGGDIVIRWTWETWVCANTVRLSTDPITTVPESGSE